MATRQELESPKEQPVENAPMGLDVPSNREFARVQKSIDPTSLKLAALAETNHLETAVAALNGQEFAAAHRPRVPDWKLPTRAKEVRSA